MVERNTSDYKILKDELDVLQRSEAGDVKAKDFLDVKNELAQLSQASRQLSTRADETDKWCSRMDKLTSEHTISVQAIQRQLEQMRHIITKLEDSVHDSAILKAKMEKIEDMQRALGLLDGRVSELFGSMETKMRHLETTAQTQMEQVGQPHPPLIHICKSISIYKCL